MRSSEYIDSGVGTQHAQCASAQEHAIKFQARHKGSAAQGHATKCPAGHHSIQRSGASTCDNSPKGCIELSAFHLQRSTTMAEILKITPAVVLIQLCLDEDTGVSLLRSDAMVVQVLSHSEGPTLGFLFSEFSVHRRHTVRR